MSSARVICAFLLPGLEGNVAVEHPAVVKLRLVCGGACVCPLAALIGLAPGGHGLPLQADLGVGRRAGARARVGRRGRRRQGPEGELTTWTAGQLCGGEREEGGREAEEADGERRESGRERRGRNKHRFIRERGIIN